MCKSVLMKVIVTSLIMIGSALFVSGCAQQPIQYVTNPLTLPVRPVLPALTQDDVQCLSDEAYKKLVRRDMLRRQYAEELEVIIQSTQQPIHSNNNE